MSEMRASMPAAVKGLRLGEHPEPHAVWSLEEAAWIEQRDQQWRLWAESAAPAPAAHPRQLVSVSSIDVERLIAECLPGGSVCDPQAVADNIRRYCNAWPGAAPAAQPLTEAPAELRGLDTASRVRFYEHDFYVLSNFSAFTLYWRGLRFDTSEAAYHFEKFTDSDGAMADVAAIRHAILKAPSAHEAFKIAERNKAHRRPDWDDVKVGIMLDILRAKAQQHEYVRRKLLDTGIRELVEDSWRDDFWGWGPNRDGKNMLGRLWMQVRAELRAAGATHA